MEVHEGGYIPVIIIPSTIIYHLLLVINPLEYAIFFIWWRAHSRHIVREKFAFAVTVKFR